MFQERDDSWCSIRGSIECGRWLSNRAIFENTFRFQRFFRKCDASSHVLHQNESLPNHSPQSTHHAASTLFEPHDQAFSNIFNWSTTDLMGSNAWRARLMSIDRMHECSVFSPRCAARWLVCECFSRCCERTSGSASAMVGHFGMISMLPGSRTPWRMLKKTPAAKGRKLSPVRRVFCMCGERSNSIQRLTAR